MISGGQGAGNLVRIGHMGADGALALPRRRAGRRRADVRRPRRLGRRRGRRRCRARGALGDGGGGRVTLPPFELHRPQTVEEATELASTASATTPRSTAAAPSSCSLLKLGFASFGHLVDLKGDRRARGIRAENGTLVVGATSRTASSSARTARARAAARVSPTMERRVANLRVRERRHARRQPLLLRSRTRIPRRSCSRSTAEVECRRG